MFEIKKPSKELIRKRAYELFVERGCVHGNDKEDWRAAEQELTIQLLLQEAAFAQAQYRVGGKTESRPRDVGFVMSCFE